jgi:hypothetical protein
LSLFFIDEAIQKFLVINEQAQKTQEDRRVIMDFLYLAAELTELIRMSIITFIELVNISNKAK